MTQMFFTNDTILIIFYVLAKANLMYFELKTD
ncbi:hypothetical protein SAMN05421857_1303 [Chryseobacterium formosense]|nr:hypothetical protein SAMN05421857_1303 [Chryseobacterium formosense]